MFGEVLRELRKSRGITQQKLAEVLGVSGSSIALYETNRRQPSNALLMKIANFFGVSVDYLLRDTKKETVSREFPNQLPLHRVPIIGKISAGLPNYAFDDPDGYAVYTG